MNPTRHKEMEASRMMVVDHGVSPQACRRDTSQSLTQLGSRHSINSNDDSDHT
jgi:hypothetical protein